MEESLPGALIELCTQKVCLSTNLLSFFTSILHLQTWLKESKVLWDFEMELKEGRVGGEPSPEEPLTEGVPHVDVAHAGVLVEVLVVLTHLLLGVYVLEELGSLPPVFIGLDHDGLWLHLLDKLLSSLSKHGRQIRATHQEDFLSIESLSEVDES